MRAVMDSKNVKRQGSYGNVMGGFLNGRPTSCCSSRNKGCSARDRFVERASLSYLSYTGQAQWRELLRGGNRFLMTQNRGCHVLVPSGHLAKRGEACPIIAIAPRKTPSTIPLVCRTGKTCAKMHADVLLALE